VCPLVFWFVVWCFLYFFYYGGWCQLLASGGRRLAAVISSSMTLRRTEPREIKFSACFSASINSSGSRICKWFPGSFSACKATAAVDKGQRRGGPTAADWEGAHPRRISRSGYGALWLPADSIDPPFLQAKGWPIYFLPALMPKGRQPAFCSSSMARCCGGSAVPSGDVPGDDGAMLRRKQFRTQLQSLSAFRGPLCTIQGPVCNFSFPRGPTVRCAVLQCFE
jgi:hypothetical protein